MLGLVDLAYEEPIDWWLVFRDSEHHRPVFEFFLKPGFRHVELWRPTDGVWLRIDPCMEFVENTVHERAPWELMPDEWNCTFLRVQQTVRHGGCRKPFFIGPITCVELTAAILGVKTPLWCRTPHQLYTYLFKRGSRFAQTETPEREPKRDAGASVAD